MIGNCRELLIEYLSLENKSRKRDRFLEIHYKLGNICADAATEAALGKFKIQLIISNFQEYYKIGVELNSWGHSLCVIIFKF